MSRRRSRRASARVRRSLSLILIGLLMVGVIPLAYGCTTNSASSDTPDSTYTPTQSKAVDGDGNALPPFPVVSMTPGGGTRLATATKARPPVTVILTATPAG